MTRRCFLKEGSAGAIGLCCATSIVSLTDSCTTLKYVDAVEDAGQLKVLKSDFSKENFVIVKSGRLPAPVYLSPTAENTYAALLMLCTHKACELRPAGNFLSCPCHGSEFSNTGKVLKSPAEKELAQYPVTTDESAIYIHITR